MLKADPRNAGRLFCLPRELSELYSNHDGKLSLGKMHSPNIYHGN